MERMVGCGVYGAGWIGVGDGIFHPKFSLSESDGCDFAAETSTSDCYWTRCLDSQRKFIKKVLALDYRGDLWRVCRFFSQSSTNWIDFEREWSGSSASFRRCFSLGRLHCVWPTGLEKSKFSEYDRDPLSFGVSVSTTIKFV